MKKTIIVFDGYCILCSNFVSFITKLDNDDEFRFTTFESEFISNNYPKISGAESSMTRSISTQDNKYYLLLEAGFVEEEETFMRTDSTFARYQIASPDPV